MLNKTNNRTIRGAFGDAVDGWAGKIIVVFPTMAEFRGKMEPALRVRIPPPKQRPERPSGSTAKPAADDEPDTGRRSRSCRDELDMTTISMTRSRLTTKSGGGL